MRYFIPTSNSHYFDSLAYIKIDENETRYYKNGNVEKLPAPLFVVGNPMLLEVSETEALARMPKKEPELLYFIPGYCNSMWLCATHTLQGNDLGTAYRFDGSFIDFGSSEQVKDAVKAGNWKQVSMTHAISSLNDYDRKLVRTAQAKAEAMKKNKVVVTATQKEEPKTRYFIPKQGVSYMNEIAYASVTPCGTKGANHYRSGRIENFIETKDWIAWFKGYATWEETTKEKAIVRLKNKELVCSLHESQIAELKAKLEQVTKERDTAMNIITKHADVIWRATVLEVLKAKCPTLYSYRID